jgi:hypothetical protein
MFMGLAEEGLSLAEKIRGKLNNYLNDVSELLLIHEAFSEKSWKSQAPALSSKNKFAIQPHATPLEALYDTP